MEIFFAMFGYAEKGLFLLNERFYEVCMGAKEGAQRFYINAGCSLTFLCYEPDNTVATVHSLLFGHAR